MCSSSMASAVICLATGRKFNISKYIFESLVRNVDSSLKFYMYPRFLQLMIADQVGDLSSHTTKYTSPALTEKVFANMRRVAVDEVDDVVAEDAVKPTPPSPTHTSPPPQELPSTSQEDALWDFSDDDSGTSLTMRGIIAEIDADEDVILEEVDAEKEVEVADKDAEVVQDAVVQGRQ
nr:hypothetical protein [Tanacetum cinerariifolium]